MTNNFEIQNFSYEDYIINVMCPHCSSPTPIDLKFLKDSLSGRVEAVCLDCYKVFAIKTELKIDTYINK